MDDFIYLIALVAWVAFEFYRRSQKKRNAAREATQRPQPRNESRPLPTLEDILLGREPVPEPEPEYLPESTWTEGMSPVLNETAFEKEYNLRGITSVEELDKPMNLDKKSPSEMKENELETEEVEARHQWAHIDLRRAVIYSEILNRPYV